MGQSASSQDRESLGTSQIVQAFAKQGIRINGAESAGIRANVLLGGAGGSPARPRQFQGGLRRGGDRPRPRPGHRRWLERGPKRGGCGGLSGRDRRGPPAFRATAAGPGLGPLFRPTPTNLWNQGDFLSLLRGKGFHPVKISWEDIGRHHGSAWGDRISDVGIWVRRDERQPDSARLALSVRRDGNFRDKVLLVPAEKIKVHQRFRGRTIEKTLPERLRELGLASPTRDRNVIVSNQFAIVPVPSRQMRGAWAPGTPPRAAFNFSIFPYGSTNFVITDVIEGSSEAVVGPGTHQMLYADIDGRKAPFTASRAEDRQDLLRLERELKAQGMDVDVQRYYLIQVPLKKGARGIRTSDMGTPPLGRAMADSVVFAQGASGGAIPAPPPASMPKAEASKAAREPEGLAIRN